MAKYLTCAWIGFTVAAIMSRIAGPAPNTILLVSVIVTLVFGSIAITQRKL